MEKYLNAAEAIVAKAVPTRRRRRPRSSKLRSNIGVSFLHGPAPSDAAKRDAYAREVLVRSYAGALSATGRRRRRWIGWRRWRRSAIRSPGQTFEAGIGRAMVAVLASPRFLFRVEDVAAGSADQRYPLIDEYALASRLSYFLWSTMPDDELMRLAERGELRAKLTAQVAADAQGSAVEGAVGKFCRAMAASARHRAYGDRADRCVGAARELDRLQRELWKMRHEIVCQS